MTENQPLYAQAEDHLYRSGNLLSAVAIIAGTCIGAGMLALPLVTAVGGFIPSLAIGALCWFFMLCTGLLFLEATLWMEDGANVMTLTGHFLGTIGKWVGSASFLFLYYCLMVSYLAGGSQVFAALLKHMSGLCCQHAISITAFALFFGAIVYCGTRIIDRANLIFMAALILSYVMLLSEGVEEIQEILLEHMDWRLSWLALPTLFSAYGYHNVIPSLSTYLRRDVKKLSIAIVLGTLTPFIVYSLWQWLVIGIVPLNDINAAAAEGVPATVLLQRASGNSWVVKTGAFFGFFALVTSLLGVALSMVDFLGDAMKMHRTGISRLFLCTLTFIPPALLAALYPNIFVAAIGLAGGYGEAILNGLIPVFLVWRGRYHLGLHSQWKLPGGRTMLIILLLATLGIMVLESFLLFSDRS